MQALRSKFLVTPLASASTPLAEPGELLPINTWEISNGRVLAREPLRIEWPTSCFSTPGDGLPGPDDAGHSAVIVQPGEDLSRFVVALSGSPGTLSAGHGGGGHGGGGGHYGGGGHGGGGHGGGGHGGGGARYGRHGGRWGWGGWGGYGGWGWGGWPVYAYGWPVYEDWQQRPRGISVSEAIAYLTQQYGAEWWYRGAVGGVSPSGLEVVQVFVSSSEGARVLPARVGPFTVVVTVKTSNPTVGMLAGCSACVGGGIQGVIRMPRKAPPSAVAAEIPVLPSHTCPFCREKSVMQCRCRRSEMKCPNGHEWHHDGDDIHAGGSDHASPTCCADKTVIARVRRLPQGLMERLLKDDEARAARGGVGMTPASMARFQRNAGHGEIMIGLAIDGVELRSDDPFWDDYDQFLKDRASADELRAAGTVVSLGAVASKSQNSAGPAPRTRLTGDSAAPPATGRFPADSQGSAPFRPRVPSYSSSAPPASRIPSVGRYTPNESGQRVPPDTRYAPPPPAPPSSMWPPSDGESSAPPGPSPQLPDVSVLGPCPTPGACGPRIPLGPEIPFPRPMPSFPQQGIPCGTCKLKVAHGARMSDIAVRLGVPPQVLLDANAWRPGQTLSSGDDFVEAGEELVAPWGLAATVDVEPSPSLVCVKQGGQWDPATGKCTMPEVTPGVEPVVEQQKKSVVPYVVAGGVLLVTVGLFFGTLAIKAPPPPERKPRLA